MNFISLSKIVIRPDRQRQEFDPQALQDLVTSIETTGLMHPPVLRQEGNDMVLVAGERRLKAMSQIYELGGTFKCDGEVVIDGLIPYSNLGELSLLDHGPRTATVSCETECLLLLLDQRHFMGVLDQVPALAHKLLATLAGRIRDLDRQYFG